MAVYRDHPRTGGAHIAHVVTVTGGAVAGGSGTVFILVLVGAIVGDEAFGTPYDDVIDPIFRQSIGFVTLVLIAALGVTAFGLAFRRTATARQLARAATEKPDEVATWADRRDTDIVGGTPFTHVYFFGWFFVGLVALALLIFAVALQETFRYNPESAQEAVPIVIAVAALGAFVALLLLVTWKILTPQWRDAAGTVDTVWNESVRQKASASEKANRPGSTAVDFGGLHRILNVIGDKLGHGAVPVLGVGIVVFIFGVWLRQPCRRCDQRYFDRPIEDFIDVVIVIGGPLIILAAVMGIIGLTAEWIARVIETVRLRELAAEGSRAPEPAQLLPHLVGQGPAELLGIALIAASWPLVAPFAVARALSGAPVFGTLVIILLSAGVVGVLVLAWSVPVDDGMRNRFRAAWSPGDPVPVVTTTRPRRLRRSRRRRSAIVP